MPPRLTIAIPTVNRLLLFKRALASALAQSTPIDIVVSDNGSTDGTGAYLEALDLPPHVRRFRRATTVSVQRHGAFIVSQIVTEWVVFLSDDDFLEPDFAARMLQAIEEKSDVALLYTGCRLLFGSVGVAANVGPELESAEDFLFEFMSGQRNICMCATAFRVDDLRRIGPQPESCVIGDMYYWSRILTSGRMIGCVEGVLANYSFYRPGVLTETSRTPAEAWAQESQELASRMCATILAAPLSGRRGVDVERMRAKYLARTVANQLVWSALRGAHKPALFRSFRRLGSLLRGDLEAFFRAVAALAVPRAALEWLVLFRARQLTRASARKQ